MTVIIGRREMGGKGENERCSLSRAHGGTPQLSLTQLALAEGVKPHSCNWVALMFVMAFALTHAADFVISSFP